MLSVMNGTGAGFRPAALLHAVHEVDRRLQAEPVVEQHVDRAGAAEDEDEPSTPTSGGRIIGSMVR